MKTLGEILRSLRESKKISMDQMVEDLKVYGVTPSKSMISRWENNKAEPSMEYARILSKYFEVSLDYLLGLDENPHRTLDENDVFTMAAHKVGHDGPLSEEERDSIEMAIRIALARHKKL